MKEIGLQVGAEILLEGDHTMEAGAEAASSLVSLRHRPTAVVCSNDLMAIGLMHKASELYLDIPGDLSVVGFEDIPFAKYMIPQLTTVQISREEIATVAFEALLAAADPAINGDTQIVSSIATNLVVRGSTSMGPGRVRDGRRSRAGRAHAQANRFI
jgi:LacI family transcriptional regulator